MFLFNVVAISATLYPLLNISATVFTKLVIAYASAANQSMSSSLKSNKYGSSDDIIEFLIHFISECLQSKTIYNLTPFFIVNTDNYEINRNPLNYFCNDVTISFSADISSFKVFTSA